MNRILCVFLTAILFFEVGISGPFDCENEMHVNPFNGNRAPLTEVDAKKAGWTDYSGLLTSMLHSPISSVLGKLALSKQTVAGKTVAAGVTVANLKNWLQSKLDGSAWDKSKWIDASDVIDALVGYNHKYISPDGHYEAVFDPETGKLINRGPYMGTYNKDSPDGFGDGMAHIITAILPHLECVVFGDYVWDPTTQCFVVADDGKEIDVDCDTGKPVVPATQTITIDNKPTKEYLMQQLENARATALDVAEKSGLSAEYQSRSAPVISYGQQMISTIPDQQTYTVPVQVQQ